MKLRHRNLEGTGHEIQALLPKGFKLDNTDHLLEVETWVTIYSARWVQFPTKDWLEMEEEVTKSIISTLGIPSV